ncbi:unnamed protein product [Pleuronectes platessa]|uniref:Secreted protein n=1 Tax=Pleuronectes platessa TaxID=8262 RepID=A0A9N7YDE9_PLEPL|nr:unnamed protein product [Pleuronectes platessa]
MRTALLLLLLLEEEEEEEEEQEEEERKKDILCLPVTGRGMCSSAQCLNIIRGFYVASRRGWFVQRRGRGGGERRRGIFNADNNPPTDDGEEEEEEGEEEELFRTDRGSLERVRASHRPATSRPMRAPSARDVCGLCLAARRKCGHSAGAPAANTPRDSSLSSWPR